MDPGRALSLLALLVHRGDSPTPESRHAGIIQSGDLDIKVGKRMDQTSARQNPSLRKREACLVIAPVSNQLLMSPCLFHASGFELQTAPPSTSFSLTLHIGASGFLHEQWCWEDLAALAPLTLLTGDSEYVDRTDDDKHSGAPYVIPSFPTDAPCRTCFGLHFHSTEPVPVEPCRHSTVTFLPFLHSFLPGVTLLISSGGTVKRCLWTADSRRGRHCVSRLQPMEAMGTAAVAAVMSLTTAAAIV